MDEATARRVLDEIEKLNEPVNKLTELSVTFPDVAEQRAFRRILADQLLIPCVELMTFVYRQHPHLDPFRDEKSSEP